MTPAPTAQLALPLSGDEKARPSVKPRKIKPHHRPKADGPLLPLAQPRYLPVVGVPKTRAECPTERPCPHVRCRYHLWLEDADHRAGRPGLRQVTRDSRGLTVSQPGHMGDERAGTTLNPRWLRIADEPVEAERCCPAWIWFDDDCVPHVYIDNAIRWDHMRVRPGDALDIVDRIQGGRVTWAHVGADGESVVFDDLPPRYESMFIWIVRKRLIQSCALDVIDQHGKVSNEEAGFHVARHRTLVARIMRSGVRKAVETGEEMGIEKEDLVATLMRMGGMK